MPRGSLKKSTGLALKRSIKLKKEKRAALFNFNNLINELSSVIKTFRDERKGNNVSKKLKDAALAAFSMFFTQNPSFLAFQRQMQEIHGRNNVRTLFGVEELQSDNHIRELLDPTPPSYLNPLFDYVFDGLEQDGHLAAFRSSQARLLVALDGTRYFSSKNISCDNCSTTHHPKSGVSYHHDVLMAAIVTPSSNRILSLSPEFIVPQDGHDKQDCEWAAAKRWLHRHAHLTSREKVTILGDDLYSKQPFCELLLSKGYHFILTCKPTSHTTLYEYVKLLSDEMETIVVEKWVGKRKEISRYRFANKLPLRDGKDALEVNWCEIEVEIKGKIKYKNTFITDFPINRNNVVSIVEDGRARWKIENENNNVLKNRGYNLEHNFGHGKKNLSALFLTLNLMAFLFHTLLDIFDEKYGQLRKKTHSRKTFFNDIRTLTKFLCFRDWERMMEFMIRGLKEAIPVGEISLYAYDDSS